MEEAAAHLDLATLVAPTRLGEAAAKKTDLPEEAAQAEVLRVAIAVASRSLRGPLRAVAGAAIVRARRGARGPHELGRAARLRAIGVQASTCELPTRRVTCRAKNGGIPPDSDLLTEGAHPRPDDNRVGELA